MPGTISTTDYTTLTGAGNFVDIKNYVTAPKGKYYIGKLTFTGTYGNDNGVAVNLKLHGIKTVHYIQVLENNSNYGVSYDYTDGKIQIWTGINTELGSAINIANLKLTIAVIGTS